LPPTTWALRGDAIACSSWRMGWQKRWDRRH